MRIEGVYKFSASRELVWSLLKDPVTISDSLPGCDEFDQISTSKFAVALSIQRGPFKGHYHGHIASVGGALRDGFDITINGEGPDGTIVGTGRISLLEQDGMTTVLYEGVVDLSGALAEKHPRMLRTTSNALVRQFFEAFDRHIQIQTGVHTTRLDEHITRERRPSTIDMQDAVANAMKDRQTTWLVFSVIFLVLMTITGAFMILFSLVRWVKHTLNRPVAKLDHQKQENIDPQKYT